MSWETELEAIAARFRANSPVASSKIAWDAFNLVAQFTPPVVSAADPDAAVWVRPFVVPVSGSATPLGLGASARRYREGVIGVQVFAPAGSGGDKLTQVAEQCGAIFHRAQFGQIKCREAEYEFLEVDGAFASAMMRCSYYVDEPN